jgi:hypothetical protein
MFVLFVDLRQRGRDASQQVFAAFTAALRAAHIACNLADLYLYLLDYEGLEQLHSVDHFLLEFLDFLMEIV